MFSLAVSIIVVFAALPMGAQDERADREDGARPAPAAVTPPRDDEIAALIRALADPVFAKRTDATRRLCAIGMPALAALREASKGDDFEVARRTQRIVAVWEQVWFAGVDIELSLSHTSIAWNEPVDLRLTFTNRSNYPARLPFHQDAGAKGAIDGDAAQVGAMLDVADWLTVLGPDGRSVDLHVDDISLDANVAAAVDERVDQVSTSVLEPGGAFSMTVSAFNRGWSRYRLLDAGAYAVGFEFEPAWEDQVLAAAHVGRVVARGVVLTVKRGAPEDVSRHGIEVSLTLDARGDRLMASLTNHTDVPMVINTHFGRAVPFAQGNWVCTVGDVVREVAVSAGENLSWRDFSGERWVRVLPGERLKLAEIDIRELRATAAEMADAFADGSWEAYFRYANVCTRDWQLRQGKDVLDNPSAPEALRRPLPRGVLGGRHSSGAVLISPGQ